MRLKTNNLFETKLRKNFLELGKTVEEKLEFLALLVNFQSFRLLCNSSIQLITD